MQEQVVLAGCFPQEVYTWFDCLRDPYPLEISGLPSLFIVNRGYTNPSLTRDWPSTLLIRRPSFRALQIFNTAVLRAGHARRHLGQ